MQILSFTDQRIAKLTAPAAGRVSYQDAKTPGLQVTVTANGTRSFYLLKRSGRRVLRLFLGRYPEIRVSGARTEAARALAELAGGNDPSVARRRRRNEATLADLFECWRSIKQEVKRSWEGDQRLYDKHLSHWQRRPLSTITLAEVQGLHTQLKKDHGPYLANRVLALLSAMYGQSSKLGSALPNPCKGVGRFPEVKRDRFLGREELRRFFDAILAEYGP